jgi:oxygen-dependent protoporphyrinogen oxidase
MDIAAEPIFYEITRWHQSMPKYPVGHVEQLKMLREELLTQKPGLLFCGAGYLGVGIPDCVKQGKSAAQQLLNYCSD